MRLFERLLTLRQRTFTLDRVEPHIGHYRHSATIKLIIRSCYRKTKCSLPPDSAFEYTRSVRNDASDCRPERCVRQGIRSVWAGPQCLSQKSSLPRFATVDRRTSRVDSNGVDRAWECLRQTGTVRILPPPAALPQFALRQHGHPRFHNDAANIWFRQLIKRTFERYPDFRAE